jgi:hypothetical protein
MKIYVQLPVTEWDAGFFFDIVKVEGGDVVEISY